MQRFNKALLAARALATTGMIWIGSASAWADAQEPSISGDRWVAYAVLGGLVLAVIIFVFASVGIARRDERAHAGQKEDDGLPILGSDDD